jgi:hypothetical protein
MKLRGHTDNIRTLLLDSTGRYILLGLQFFLDLYTKVTLGKFIIFFSSMFNLGISQFNICNRR